jgi:phosphatidylcholine synthase
MESAMFEKNGLLTPKKKVRRKAKRRIPRPPKPHKPHVRFLAWCVHLYTALGLLAAASIAKLLVQGGSQSFRWSFALMAFATFVDSTDGTLARKIKIKEVLPNFDGRKLDDITDFLTYTFLPLLLVWRANILPAGTDWCLLLPLLASAYGFCQSAAKTDDGYFLGFPSLWNVVAFYLYVLQVPPWGALGVVVALAALTFVPSRYLYTSQPGRMNVALNILALLWVPMLGWLLWELPSAETLRTESTSETFRTVALTSLFYPALYMVASWWISTSLWARQQAEEARLFAELEPPPHTVEESP